MKDAKTLLLEFLAVVTHGQDAAALFAEDGAVELPFLHSLGIPWRHRGRQAIRELQNSLGGLYLDFGFPPEDTHVLIDTPARCSPNTWPTRRRGQPGAPSITCLLAVSWPRTARSSCCGSL
jgi:hypothetical protein